MRILITNDDGIRAPGICALAERLAERAEVLVVAPERQQSAASHGITLHKPLHVTPVEIAPGVTAYEVNGTPADCVKLALGALCSDQPDIVVSGINEGANLGLDILYSGTAAAAAEAALLGLPALAVSLTAAPFEFAAGVRVTERLAEEILQRKLAENTFLNVNVPPGPYELLCGIAVTRLGVRAYRNAYEQRIDPLGRPYYWQAGEPIRQPNDEDTDVRAVERRQVSVTPVHFDFTNARLLATLSSWKLTL